FLDVERPRLAVTNASYGLSTGRNGSLSESTENLAVHGESPSFADLAILLEIREVGEPLGDRHLADEYQALEQIALGPAGLAFAAAAQVLELMADDRRQDGDVHVLAGKGVVDDRRPA